MASSFSPAGGEKLVLGSGSPRRSTLLAELGVEFEVRAADVDESTAVGVAAIARLKFEALAAALADRTIMTADTLVMLDGRALGKPVDREDATAMIMALSGRTHHVKTATAFGRAGRDPKVLTTTTSVTLRTLAVDEVRTYVATGAGDDKAGSLALQAEAAPFIAATRGCWSNMMGLPVCDAAELLGIAAPRRLAAQCTGECPLRS